jgi:UDP-GlcNAc3NAcA epimerase
MKKIITILGARPQFIKASVISEAIASSSGLTECMIHTGQHYDKNMSNSFFDDLGIPAPKYNLGIGGGSHGEMTGLMLIEIEKILTAEDPDLVIVYGDTNSTLAGALAAAKLNIPIAHIEAGLRSFNSKMPEEINRVLVDHISTWLFAPTEGAAQMLICEGINSDKINIVGDVMYDAAMRYGDDQRYPCRILESMEIRPYEYILLTLHRAENTDSDLRLKKIIESLLSLAKNKTIVCPLHPRTLKALKRVNLFDEFKSNIRVIDPIGFIDMLHLEKFSELIITDSGGVQKEAFFYSRPCVTLRTETEWTELIDGGWNVLVQVETSENIQDQIISRVGTIGANISPYGNGDAVKRIIRVLEGAQL